MMQLLVDDLDAWWTRISSLDLPGHFGVATPKEPVIQPLAATGLRVHLLRSCPVWFGSEAKTAGGMSTTSMALERDDPLMALCRTLVIDDRSISPRRLGRL